MKVRISGRVGGGRISRAALKRRIEAVSNALAPPGSELSIRLVGDREMAALNLRYRGRRGPTDVLSFSQREGPYAKAAGALLGDVVVSVDTAARQACASGGTLRREVDRLVLHGLLHLLGYDHERSAAEGRRMRRKEAALLRRIESRRPRRAGAPPVR